MVRPVELKKTEVEKNPSEIWNAFIDVVGQDLKDLTDIQSAAHFAFYYDNEIQNGGHCQFFENAYVNYKEREDWKLLATIKALKEIGAVKQGKILEEAADLYLSRQRTHPTTIKEFSELELEDEFETFDRRYYNCDPEIPAILEKFIHKHLDEFVKII